MKYVVSLEQNEFVLLNNIEVYKAVLNGELKTFPRKFWTGEEGKVNAIDCMRYLVEEILEYNEDDIRNKMRQKKIIEYKLGGMLKALYKDSAYLAINDLYKDKFYPWEFNWCPKGFWKVLENRKKAFVWMLDKENLTSQNIFNNINALMFRKNRITGLIEYYNGRLVDLVVELHPDETVVAAYKNLCPSR